MLATQTVIDALAERIERAYRLRQPDWHGGCSTPRVWAAAAEGLLRAHEADPSIPLDPELFVAAQPVGLDYPDPWRDLTQPTSVRGYVQRVRGIVRRLRRELSEEVRRAEARVGAGEPIAHVLGAENRRISPLGRYVVAYRAERPALAERFRDGAAAQHRACPLYRQACDHLLPPGTYPSHGRDAAPRPREAAQARARAQPNLN